MPRIATQPHRHELLARAIAEDITSGRLMTGERLPSERDLAERYGVTKGTVRQALLDLTNRGLVSAQQGRGTYVTAGRLSELPNTLMSFSELAAHRNLTAGAIVLKRVIESASPQDVELFAVAPGTEVLVLSRLRTLDTMPVAIDRGRIPLNRASSLRRVNFGRTSLYQAMRDRGIGPEDADYTIRAVAAGPAEAKQLGVPRGAPLLAATTLAYDGSGRAVQHGEVIYRGDRYQFRVRMTRRPGLGW